MWMLDIPPSLSALSSTTKQKPTFPSKPTRDWFRLMDRDSVTPKDHKEAGFIGAV